MFLHFTQCFVSRLIEGEVFLVWDGGDKVKSQKDLAKGAKLGIKDDIRILDYYRFYFISTFVDINIRTLVMISGIYDEVLSHYQIDPSFHLLLTPLKYQSYINANKR